MVDAPDVPSADIGCCGKLALLWATNKPLAIFLLVIAFIINLGIIFLIVYFLIIKPKQDKSNEAAVAHAATQHLAHTVMHLRSMIHG